MNIDKLRGIIAHLEPGPAGSEIQTGSLDAFAAAVARRVDLVEDKSKGLDCSFCGINVTSNSALPPNRAVLWQDGQVVAVIDLES